jgi:hypothetical protein
MLRYFLAYRLSQAVGCYKERASQAEGDESDDKHEFEPTGAQQSSKATLSNTPMTTLKKPVWRVSSETQVE